MKKIIDDNKISFFVISVCVMLIVFVSGLVVFHENVTLDKYVYEFLINNFSSKFMDVFMMSVTKFANTGVVLFVSFFVFLILYIRKKYIKLSFVFILSMGITVFVNQFLKFTFKRIRPDINKMVEISGYSFPSGHAMVSVILYGLIAYIGYKCIKNKVVKNILLFVCVLLILLIGISRVYVGVHYFSDVFTGQLISVIILVVIINWLEKKFFSKI